MSYYAIRNGRHRGICRSWDDSKGEVNDNIRASFKKFSQIRRMSDSKNEDFCSYTYRGTRTSPYSTGGRYSNRYIKRSRSAPDGEEDKDNRIYSLNVSKMYKQRDKLEIRDRFSKIRTNSNSEDLLTKWESIDWCTASNQPVSNLRELEEMNRAFQGLNVELNSVPEHAVRDNEKTDEFICSAAK